MKKLFWTKRGMILTGHHAYRSILSYQRRVRVLVQSDFQISHSCSLFQAFFFSSWIFLPRSTIWTPGTGYKNDWSRCHFVPVPSLFCGNSVLSGRHGVWLALDLSDLRHEHSLRQHQPRNPNPEIQKSPLSDLIWRGTRIQLSSGFVATFIKDRQVVRIHSTFSEPLPINCGIPQGIKHTRATFI